jgi:hypothetical protein
MQGQLRQWRLLHKAQAYVQDGGGAAPDIIGACLGAVTAALARANIVSPDVAWADPAVMVALVSTAPEAVPAIPDVESAPASIDQGV